MNKLIALIGLVFIVVSIVSFIESTIFIFNGHITLGAVAARVVLVVVGALVGAILVLLGNLKLTHK